MPLACAGVRCTRMLTSRSSTLGRRSLHATTTRRQTDSKDEAGGRELQPGQKTFRGQLYESTLTRVRLEKEPQRQMAEQRQAARSTSGLFGATNKIICEC